MIGEIASAVIGAGSDIAGGYLSGERAEKASKKAYKRALEFAQNGIQWKVADANAAGINPYFALGAPTATYSDSGIGASGGIGEGMSSAGQSLSRAMLANTSPAAKAEAAMQAAQLINVNANTELVKAKTAAELALLKQAGSGPGYVAPFDVTNPGRNGNGFVSQPGKNAQFQPAYGEGADMLTYPDLIYDLIRQPGNLGDPRIAANARASLTSLWDELSRTYAASKKTVYDAYGW